MDAKRILALLTILFSTAFAAFGDEADDYFKQADALDDSLSSLEGAEQCLDGPLDGGEAAELDAVSAHALSSTWMSKLDGVPSWNLVSGVVALSRSWLAVLPG